MALGIGQNSLGSQDDVHMAFVALPYSCVEWRVQDDPCDAGLYRYFSSNLDANPIYNPWISFRQPLAHASGQRHFNAHRLRPGAIDRRVSFCHDSAFYHANKYGVRSILADSRVLFGARAANHRRRDCVEVFDRRWGV